MAEGTPPKLPAETAGQGTSNTAKVGAEEPGTRTDTCDQEAPAASDAAQITKDSAADSPGAPAVPELLVVKRTGQCHHWPLCPVVRG